MGDIGEESDSTPSLADASASMKRQIQTDLEEAVVVPSTQVIPPQPLFTPVKSDSSKFSLVSTPSHQQVSPTSVLLPSNLPKVANLQQSPTPPATKTPSRESKSIVIMDSDGDWTVGGKETPLFKSKAGTTRKLKKPIQFKKLKKSSLPDSSPSIKDQGQPTLLSQPPTTTLTRHSSHLSMPKCDMKTIVCGSGQATPVITTSLLADCSPATSSPPATGFSTPVKDEYEVKSSWVNAVEGPVHFKTPRRLKVSPRDAKESEVKKVKKDNMSPPSKNDLHGQPELRTTEVKHRSPPKCESTGQATPASSPRSLKKFALGLRQSGSLGRGAFGKEDWSFFARQRKPEEPQDCPACGRTFGSGAGLSLHMRKKH